MIENLYNIAVIGGGLPGFACAVEAAQRGKKVLLVEKRPALGWESTWAFQLNFAGVNSAIGQRIVDELQKAGGLRQNRADAPILEMILDRIAAEVGLSVLFYSYPVRLIFEDDAAFGVVIGNKSGEQIVRAEVIVDATEDALLWRQTGAKARENDVCGLQTAFLNHIDNKSEIMKLPMDLGAGVSVQPSVWEDEVCVEFPVHKYNPLVARQTMPDILRMIRREVASVMDSLVTHAGNEPFPMSPVIDIENRSTSHPDIKNFFGAGVWAAGVDNTPMGRLALGEEVGKMAARRSWQNGG
jgi:hypothetical protein